MIEGIFTYYPDGTLQREQLLDGKEIVSDIYYNSSGKVLRIKEMHGTIVILDALIDESGNEQVVAKYDSAGVINSLVDNRSPDESTLFYFYENNLVACKMVIYKDGGRKQLQYFLNDGTLVYARSWKENGDIIDSYDLYLEEV